MNKVTLSLEDYNELKAKADAFELVTAETKSIVTYYRNNDAVYNILESSELNHELIEAIKKQKKQIGGLLEKIIRAEHEPKKDKSLWQRLFK